MKPEDAAHFVMRCIFTIFAADVGLLPKAKLITLLEDCARSPATFVPMFEAMWACLDADEYKRRFFPAFGDHLPHINGGLFSDSHAFPLGEPEIRRLILAASKSWKDVEPAIFGSLLEHALDADERRRLGAHYTPRRYVERMVDLTIMEVLRKDWAAIQRMVEQACDEHDVRGAVRLVRGFHEKLCGTRVLTQRVEPETSIRGARADEEAGGSRCFDRFPFRSETRPCAVDCGTPARLWTLTAVLSLRTIPPHPDRPLQLS